MPGDLTNEQVGPPPKLLQSGGRLIRVCSIAAPVSGVVGACGLVLAYIFWDGADRNPAQQPYVVLSMGLFVVAVCVRAHIARLWGEAGRWLATATDPAAVGPLAEAVAATTREEDCGEPSDDLVVLGWLGIALRFALSPSSTDLGPALRDALSRLLRQHTAEQAARLTPNQWRSLHDMLTPANARRYFDVVVAVLDHSARVGDVAARPYAETLYALSACGWEEERVRKAAQRCLAALPADEATVPGTPA